MDVKIINGRNGAFRVGTLQTEIGHFAIKDKMLDQYEEGSYEGLFNISKIFVSSYSAGGRLVVEMRAILENIALVTVEDSEPVPFNPLEQDPLEEEVFSEAERPVEPSLDSVEPGSSSDDEKTAAESDLSADADAVLFGRLWPLQEVFKLDSTLDRVLLREQRDRLKALGYIFKPIGQYWTRS